MKNRNVLFVTPQIDAKIGGGVVTSVVEDVLRENASSFYKVSFPLYKSAAIKLKNQLRGYTAGMTHKAENEIVQLVQSGEFDVVIFNTSYFGLTMKRLKKQTPHIRFICYFHNVEYIFVRDAIRKSKNLGSLLTLFVSWCNEKYSVQYSDLILCLNDRDSEVLKRMYGRGADYICPLCLEDRFDKLKFHATTNTIGAFIGSNFYANYLGIIWFMKNVAPFIATKILIIGKGFERCRMEFEAYPNIEVIGTVDNLDDYYYDIDFIVSPIFDGSGMKTKTAEALMYGKTIFGTTEAFQGYDIDFEKIGGLCNTAQEFIDKINLFRKKDNQFNPDSRNCYLMKYSVVKLKTVLTTVLE